MNQTDFRKDIMPVLFLTIVVCIAVIALTVVDGITGEKIAENDRQKTLEGLKEMFPEMDGFDMASDIDVFIIKIGDEVVGYAFNVTAQGYGGDIGLIVGIENTTLAEDDIILRGISITKHSETPALGAEIVKPYFKDQFEGLSASEVALTKDGGQIDAITGATISSSAVSNAVHDAIIEKAELIRTTILEVE